MHLLQPSQRMPFWLARTGFEQTSQGYISKQVFLRVADDELWMAEDEWSGPGFVSISPHSTNLETLKVDTEFGYRVTPVSSHECSNIKMVDLRYQRNMLVFCKIEVFQTSNRK